METDAATYNRMCDEFGCTEERCVHCGLEIWADQEVGVYFDARVLAGNSWSFLCPGSTEAHETSEG